MDLSALPASSDTASLVARSDARGGVTVWTVDREGSVMATAFHADGTVDSSVHLFAPTAPDVSAPQDAGVQQDAEADADAGPPTVHDVEATPAGWLASWDGRPAAGWISVDDAQGNVVANIPLATNTATFDLGPDGTLGVNDGASIGWVPPGWGTEQLALTYAPGNTGSFDLDPGPGAAWSSAIAYVIAADLSSNIESVARGGATFTFPGPSVTYPSSIVLLPGADGRSASVLTASGDPTAPGVTLAFASTQYPLRTFQFDPTLLASAPVAAAPRTSSGGVALAWVGGDPSSSMSVALGFTEVAPTGARGSLVPLGNLAVAPAQMVLAGSSGGGSYLAIAWNGAVRAGFVVSCSG
jgi:hypothetical protein